LFGSVTIADVPAAHPYNQVWTRMATVTPMSPPAPGRYLRGYVQMTSGSTVIGKIGRAHV
jgi:hypothetical protein